MTSRLRPRGTPMAQLVRQQQIDVFVGYHAFGLQESDDAELDLLFPDDFDFGTFLSTHPGRLDITSAGHTHTAALTVEVWDGSPPARDSGGWEEQAEADFESVSGRVAVWSMSLGRLDDLIALAETGGSWRVRVGSSGRAAVKALTESEGSIEGVEHYLVQFWPAGSSPSVPVPAPGPWASASSSRLLPTGWRSPTT